MALGSLLLRIDAETKGAERDLARVQTIVEGWPKSAAFATAGITRMEGSIRAMSSMAMASFMGVSATLSALKSGFDQAAEGAKILSAEAFFKHSGKDIESYRKAVQGMVSDAELMKRANLADSMGIDEETFKQLAKVAQASAQKTGQSFEYMFNSIIVGTARSSRLLLDNLGIIVSVKQANVKYAQAHKTAAQSVDAFVESMTAEQKQLAFVNEVRVQSNKTLIEANKVGETAVVKFEKLSAKIDNMTDSWKKMLTAIVATELGDKNTSLVDYFRNTFDFIAEDTSRFVSWMRRTLHNITEGALAGGIAGAGAGLLTGGALSAPMALGGALAECVVDAFIDVAPDEGMEWSKLVDQSAVAASKLEAMTPDIDRLAANLTAMSKSGISTADAFDAVSAKTADQVALMEKQGGATNALLVETWKLIRSIKGMSDALPTVPSGKAGKGGKKPKKATDLLDPATESAMQEIIKQRDSEDEVDAKAEAWLDDLIADSDKALREMQVAERKALSEWEKSFTQTTAGKVAEAFDVFDKKRKAQMDGALVSLIGGLEALVEGGFNRENILKVSGDIATTLASAVNPVVGALVGLASTIVQTTVDYFSSLGDAFQTPGAGLGERRLTASELQKQIKQDILTATGYTEEQYNQERDAAWWSGQMDAFNKEVGAALDDYYEKTGYSATDRNRARLDRSRGPSALERAKDEIAEANRRATEANTQALRDLAREFRNMPSGYKTQRAIYDTSAPSRALGTAISGVSTTLDASVLDSVWRNRGYG